MKNLDKLNVLYKETSKDGKLLVVLTKSKTPQTGGSDYCLMLYKGDEIHAWRWYDDKGEAMRDAEDSVKNNAVPPHSWMK